MSQKTLPTAMQEADALRKGKIMTARSKSALSYVKRHRPELFDRGGDEPLEKQESSAPFGFKAYGEDGWFQNPDTGVFLQPCGRRVWFNAEKNEYQDIFEGTSLPFTVVGGASSSTGSGRVSAPKYLFIPDMHRTAQALKVDLSHLHRPSAMLAVLGPAATAPHECLIRTLAASKGEWSEQALCFAVAGSLQPSATEAKASSAGEASAVALVIGQQAIAAASQGACCRLLSGPSASSVAAQAASATGVAEVISHQLSESASSASESLCLMLCVGEHAPPAESEAVEVPSRALQGRPRAASIELLQRARSLGYAGSLGIGFLRLSPACASAETAPQGGQPSSKRPRLVGVDAREVPGRVRARQILLRTWRGGAAPKPQDPVRRKAVQRSQEEAEARLLRVLEELLAAKEGLPRAFTTACRASSECPSSLQGGELSGDLGFLDKEKGVDMQRANGKMVKAAVPAPVLKAAFELEVGEISDLVSSDVGVHLLLRSA